MGNCQLCKEPAVGFLDFETGNNAEYGVTLSLCEAHCKEAEDIGYAFEEKYGQQILDALYETWRALADAP